MLSVLVRMKNCCIGMHMSGKRLFLAGVGLYLQGVLTREIYGSPFLLVLFRSQTTMVQCRLSQKSLRLVFGFRPLRGSNRPCFRVCDSHDSQNDWIHNWSPRVGLFVDLGRTQNLATGLCHILKH